MELDASGGLLYDSTKTYCVECSEPIEKEDLVYCAECDATMHRACVYEGDLSIDSLCGPCMEEEDENRPEHSGF